MPQYTNIANLDHIHSALETLKDFLFKHRYSGAFAHIREDEAAECTHYFDRDAGYDVATGLPVISDEAVCLSVPRIGGLHTDQILDENLAIAVRIPRKNDQQTFLVELERNFQVGPRLLTVEDDGAITLPQAALRNIAAPLNLAEAQEQGLEKLDHLLGKHQLTSRFSVCENPTGEHFVYMLEIRGDFDNLTSFREETIAILRATDAHGAVLPPNRLDKRLVSVALAEHVPLPNRWEGTLVLNDDVATEFLVSLTSPNARNLLS